jgi:lysozyme
VDDTAAKYKKAAAPYNYKWGSFHFGTGSEVDAQVDHNQKGCCLKPTEPNPQGPTMTLNQAREFVSLFEHLTGRYPVLYGGHGSKRT